MYTASLAGAGCVGLVSLWTDSVVVESRPFNNTCSLSFRSSCITGRGEGNAHVIGWLFTSSSLSSECYSSFLSEKMGPQLNLPEAIDLVSG